MVSEAFAGGRRPGGICRQACAVWSGGCDGVSGGGSSRSGRGRLQDFRFWILAWRRTLCDDFLELQAVDEDAVVETLFLERRDLLLQFG